MITKLKSFKNHQGFMKYFKNTSWLFGEKILRMVVGLFVGIWVARYLGPEQFGLFSYAQSFVGLFLAIATLGLDGIVVRELVKDENLRSELIGTAFWLKLMGAFGVLIVLAIAVNFTSNDIYTNILVFMIASATIFQSFNVVDFYFQSRVMSKYIVYSNIISLLISSFLKVVLILNEAPLIAFAWVVLFDSFILAGGFIYFFLKKSTFTIENLKFNKSIAVDLLRNSWPFILSGIAIAIYMKIDQVMIKEMIGSEAVGQYAAAVKLSGAAYFIPMVIASSLFPAIINLKQKSEDLYNKRLKSFYSFMIWVGIVITLPLWFLSEPIVITLFGIDYKQAIDVFNITIFIVILIFISSVHSKWLLVENLQKYSLLYSFTGMITNIIANLYLIPRMGIIGAAYGTLLAQTVPYIWLIRNYKTRHQLLMIISSFVPLYLLKRN